MIYVVTNRKILGKENLFEVIEKLLQYGVKNIILREKDLGEEELYKIALKLKGITDNYAGNLIINGSLKVSEKIEAYAYHASFGNFIKEGRKYKKTGVSVHSLEEAKTAEKLGADYLLCGNVYETSCKPGLKGKGLNYIRNIVENTHIPVIAIGGISEENIKKVIEAGASGAAIMSSAMKEPQVVKRLFQKLN